MIPTVVIGLGIMGGAIARHLAAAGVDVRGYDVCAQARAAAASHGVVTLDGLDELTDDASTIILSLPSIVAAQQVVATIASFAAPCIVIETSTLALREKMALRDTLHEAGHCMLDCPISGTGGQMQDKDVVVYASGDAQAIAQTVSTMQLFSRQVLNLGDFGNGTRMKMIANHLVAVHNVAAAEAVLLGMKAGFSMDTLLAAITPGAGNSRMFELRGPNVAERRYSPPAMKLSVWSKDMQLIAAFVDDMGSATPLFDAAASLYGAALEAGYGDQDTSSVAEILRAASATTISPENEEE